METQYDPNDRTMFAFVGGRYYVAMYFIMIPPEVSKFNKGGNITGLLWRPLETPRDWVLQWRFRHYQDNNPWGKDDEKNWYCGELNDRDEATVRADTLEMFNTISGCAQLIGGEKSKLHILDLSGEIEKVMDILTNKPPFWLQSQQQISA